jgi:hypothetical protein
MKAFLAVLVCTTTLVAAQPAKVDVAAAEQFRKDLRAAVDQGAGPINGVEQQRTYAIKLAEIERRSKRLFGDVFNPVLGSCVKAAGFVQSAWTERVFAKANPTPTALAGIARLSFEAGVEYWACRTAIDALTPPAKSP